MIMDLLFYRLNPMRYLWDLVAWCWKAFKWFFLMDWWTPTTFIGKVLKPPVVVFVNIPGSIPATTAWFAAGMPGL